MVSGDLGALVQTLSVPSETGTVSPQCQSLVGTMPMSYHCTLNSSEIPLSPDPVCPAGEQAQREPTELQNQPHFNIHSHGQPSHQEQRLPSQGNLVWGRAQIWMASALCLQALIPKPVLWRNPRKAGVWN